MRVSSNKTWLNNQRVKAIELSFRQKSNHFKKKIAIPFRKKNVEVATRNELTELVEKRNYSDALLGWTFEVDNDHKFNFFTFDHIEPVSHIKHINDSFGIGNIHPLCQILNNIKGNYSEKELCRWLILLLNAYHRKYAPARK